ncbi:hypothetical protein [Methylobacterium sp. R2-1]|uniref:hypothetical protein n=1 Tax=Methylobacterium sp. R2-1 TaxID=2587064 RepID=UPI00161A63AE|nr:hypothetical protein [Methylobacterium sp. R2-1]MBB2963868.1 hypothetical protein [Methylobacterium sp. R2-1]
MDTAEQASSFTRDWLTSNIQNDPTWWDRSIEERVVVEMRRLKEPARGAGIDLNDPALDDHLLDDEITATIESVHDPKAGGIKD